MDNDIFIYINPIKNFHEDFKAWFKDVLNMEIPESIISPFDAEVESANLDHFLWKEFTEMTFNLEAKSTYTFKGIGYYWMNGKTIAKCPKLWTTVEPILLAYLKHCRLSVYAILNFIYIIIIKI